MSSPRPAGATAEVAVRPAVAGLLLTGGRSSRLGTDKARLHRPGDPLSLAERLAARLSSVAAPVLEVGPARTDLPQTTGDPGEGPLTAVVAGWRALRSSGHAGPVLVLATDLPNVSERLLALLAARPETASVVPVAAGRAQPLCARWSPADLDRADALAAGGERRAGAALGPGTVYLDEAAWGDGSSDELADVDTPEAARRLGLDLEAPEPGTGPAQSP